MSNLPWRLMNLTGPVPICLPIEQPNLQDPTADAAGPMLIDLPQLDAGLYRMSWIWDAKAFDWDKLWFPMDLYNNQHQRTGPWDFDFRNITPLVPAWWLSINDRRQMGLATCAKPSAAMVAQKRLTLEVCFHQLQTGRVKITFEPFNDTRGLVPLSVKLEPEPFDSIEPVTFNDQPPLAATQRSQGHWARCVDRAPELGALYPSIMTRCVDQATSAQTPDASMAATLALGYLGLKRDDALKKMLSTIRHFIHLPHWGNPEPAGYGHNCDMGVAAILQSLAMAYHWFEPELQAHGLAEPLREKLHLQLGRFFESILTWADFWGGSLAQDHGHRSLSCFGVAAIHMRKLVPEAPRYASFAVHRMNQALSLISPDGGIPTSSYTKIQLYMEDMSIWRETLLPATGRDVYDTPGIEETISFVHNRLDTTACQVMTANPRGDRLNFYAGWSFLSAMAARGVRHAAFLVDQLARATAQKEIIPANPAATMPWMLSHLPVPNADASTSPPLPAPWDLRPIQGQLTYRPAATHVCVCVQTPSKLPARMNLRNPCDRAVFMAMEGHFTIHANGQCLIQTAEGGYRMKSNLSNVLLIDGQGGWEDQGHAMAHPGVTLRSTSIETHRFNIDTQCGYLRLNLRAMHDRNLGVVSHTRELFFSPASLRCVDVVSLDRARQLAWHFQTFARRPWSQIESDHWQLADDGQTVLTLKAHATEQLDAQVHATDVVWGYQNENDDEPFHHLKFQSRQPQSTLGCAFEITW